MSLFINFIKQHKAVSVFALIFGAVFGAMAFGGGAGAADPFAQSGQSIVDFLYGAINGTAGRIVIIIGAFLTIIASIFAGAGALSYIVIVVVALVLINLQTIVEDIFGASVHATEALSAIVPLM